MLNNPVFEVARRGALDKAAELGDVEILWQAPERGDAIRQADILRAFIRRRVDGIFVAANDAEVLRGPIDEAVAAGIPVVGFDSDSPASKRFTHYGVDDLRAGGEGGRLLLEKMGTRGKVGILHGTQGAPNLEKRIRGFRDCSVTSSSVPAHGRSRSTSTMAPSGRSSRRSCNSGDPPPTATCR
jgi:ribose transport system substrate-binding protein